MKTIGLIGGMSWESSLEYYRIINEGVKKRLGGLHSAKCLMYSFDFEEIEALQQEGRWDEATAMMIGAASTLASAGADFLVICTNTMHRMAEDVQLAVDIPLLHIADATAAAIQSQGIGKVGLLGTRFTMEEAFYKDRLVDLFGIEVMIPQISQRQLVHDVIYDELCLGNLREESRSSYRSIIGDLVKNGAEGIILGCTEIGLLIKPGDSPAPIFDTTLIHAQAAVDLALS